MMLATKNILSACRRDLIDIYKHSIDSVRPETLIKNSINFSGDNLVINDFLDDNPLQYDIKRSRIHVVGGGKCVLGMVAALGNLVRRENLQHKFSIGSISVPIDLKSKFDFKTRSLLDGIGVSCYFGSKNNLPDENSVKATKHILDCITDASKSDLGEDVQSIFLVFISGGGSACLTSPKSITLSEKLNLIQSLVQRGSDIVELNTVRRFYSDVKGGNLARHILRCNPKSKIITLILSDVLRDPIEFIASGPTYIGENDSTNLHEIQMQNVLKKYGLDAPSVFNVQNVEPIDCSATTNIILGNNRIALNAAVNRARFLGYKVYVPDEPLEGATNDALSKLLSFSQKCDSIRGDKVLVIAGGETTVKKQPSESWGVGGRLQEFCLDYLIANEQTGRSAIDLLLAASTDGQDGPTDVAGCFASLSQNEIDLEDCITAKRRHDSYGFWSRYKPDWLVKTGLTGTNVMDLYFYLKIAN